MKNQLLYKISHKFHQFGFYIYSVKYYYSDNCQKENKIKCFIKSVTKALKIFNTKYGYYEYLEIPITTKCSLRCKFCSNLIPCYKKRFDYDLKILLKSIKSHNLEGSLTLSIIYFFCDLSTVLNHFSTFFQVCEIIVEFFLPTI